MSLRLVKVRGGLGGHNTIWQPNLALHSTAERLSADRPRVSASVRRTTDG